MKIVTKLYLTFGVLLTVGLLSVGLVMWSARDAQRQLERTHLAHQQYEAYLALSNHTYQLFKQFGDAMLIGDRDQGRGERELIAKIRRDIRHIRDMIGQEIRLVGDEEIEELNRLAAIDRQINTLIGEYESLTGTNEPDAIYSEWSRLSHVLDQKVDTDFNALIQAALDDEAEEVRETREETAAKIRFYTGAAWLFGIAAIVAAGVSLTILVRDIRRPIGDLLTGARALAGGNVDHRIENRTGNEIAEVADAFNRMASEISARQQAQEQANVRLEKAVAERTEELERVLKTLKSEGEYRKQLLADVSHELRTPLTIIRGEADIALRGGMKAPEVYREALEKTRAAALHTATLVDDLLFVARQEAGQARLKLELVEIARLVRTIIDQHASLARESGREVMLINDVGDASLRCDPGRIGQVILILLENAIRYGGSNIELRLDSAPGGYAITVADDGPGMTPEEQAHAFERFFRGSNAAQRYDKGVGLGLPMAKSIVESHGGDIVLTSSPGDGVTVTFILPKRPRLEAVA